MSIDVSNDILFQQIFSKTPLSNVLSLKANIAFIKRPEKVG